MFSFEPLRHSAGMANVPVVLPGFRAARRVHHSLTASAEKRALLWLAARAPRWLSSDHLSALGVLALAGAGSAYCLARSSPWWLLAVVAGLALNWLGDSLDGTLARVRDRQGPRYGFYLDHVLDALGSALLLGGLALSGYVAPLVALGLLVAYLLLMVEAVLATYTLGEFRMSFACFGPTELRILLALGTLALWRDPRPLAFGVRWRLFDLAGGIAIAAMLAAFAVSAARNTARLYRQEPLP